LDSSFAQYFVRWQSFYGLAGAAAATLVGLIFVTVSLHLDIFGDDSESEIRALAQATLINYFYVLIIALIFLVPDQTPFGVGLPIVILGLVSISRIIATGRRRIGYVRSGIDLRRLFDRGFLFWGVVLPATIGFPLAAIGVGVLGADLRGMYWLVWIVILSLIGATMSAWNMMVSLSAYRRRRAELVHKKEEQR
jgi:hypothetical protein